MAEISQTDAKSAKLGKNVQNYAKAPQAGAIGQGGGSIGKTGENGHSKSTRMLEISQNERQTARVWDIFEMMENAGVVENW